MTTIKPYYGVTPTSSASAPKGSSTNPYTQAEYEAMLDADTWQGGYVEGMGYCMKQVTITESYPDSDSMGSEDSWASEDSDNSGNSHPTTPTTGGGGAPITDGEDSGDGNSTTGGGAFTGGGIGGNEGTSSLSPKEKALNSIDVFEKQNKNSKFFSNIPKNKLIESLRSHIQNPIKIQQGKNGTCGAAAICKYLAEFLPEQYVEAVISLYITGKYEKWNLELPESSKVGTMEQIEKIGATVTDILMQGSIINSYNYYLNYNPFEDGSGARSFMWPQCIDSFFKMIGKPGYFCWWTNMGNIQSVDFSRNNVIAGVVLEKITGYEYQFTRNDLTPNHYIQITNCENGIIEFWQYGKDVYYSKNGDAYFIYVTPK